MTMSTTAGKNFFENAGPGLGLGDCQSMIYY
jgi:hypothetical protein